MKTILEEYGGFIFMVIMVLALVYGLFEILDWISDDSFLQGTYFATTQFLNNI